MPIMIRRGHAGSYVADLQARLNLDALMHFSAYLPLIEDGRFGKNTYRRVREYQMRRGIAADGVIGPQTWTLLVGGPVPLEVRQWAEQAPVRPHVPPEKGFGYLYVTDGKIWSPAERSAGNPRAKRHKRENCMHVYVEKNQFPNVAKTMKSVVEAENKKIREVMIICHSGGAGVLQMGGASYYISPTTAEMFKYVKKQFTADCIIWVFACNFASANAKRNQFEADYLSNKDLLYGDGIRAMENLARATNCEVRATFMPHFGAFDHFPAVWAKVPPRGGYSIHLKGRDLSPIEASNIILDHFQGQMMSDNPMLPLKGAYEMGVYTMYEVQDLIGFYNRLTQ